MNYHARQSAAVATRRSVLVLAYDFSCDIAGGSLRAIKFAQHLPSFGWEPVVVTATPPSDQPSLSVGHVHYVSSPDKRLAGGIRTDDNSVISQDTIPRRLVRGINYFLPFERQLLWCGAIRRRAAALPGVAAVDAVVSFAAPYCVPGVGQTIAQQLAVPHVVDLRDDWVDRFRIDRRSNVNIWWTDSACTRMVRRADAVTVVSWPTRDRLIEIGANAFLVTNGYDEGDFDDVPMTAKVSDATGPLTLLHAGWLGSFRTLRPVLAALELLRELRPDVDVRITQLGLVEASEVDLIRQSPSGGLVDVHAQVEHRDALQAYMGHDVLLAMPAHAIPAALSGKVFEYLRARKPILLYAPTGAATRLAREVGIRWHVEAGDVAGLANTLAEMHDEKKSRTLKTNTDGRAVQRYARRRQTRALADVLDAVSNGGVGRSTGPPAIRLEVPRTMGKEAIL